MATHTAPSAAINHVREAHDWLRWLTARTCAAARNLTPEEFTREFPIGIGSVRNTLVHMLGAERIWIAVIEETDPAVSMPAAADYPTIAAIEGAWPEVHARWDSYLHRLDDAELQRVVSRVREGRTYSQRVIDALMQVPTHALYHNAQLSFMFRSMAKQLPDSSWILWARERQSVLA
jgi:uncharacterized damage-inducible protein DinB